VSGGLGSHVITDAQPMTRRHVAPAPPMERELPAPLPNCGAHGTPAPSGYDTATRTALHRRPRDGRPCHARSRPTPPSPLHRRTDGHRQKHAAAKSHSAGPRRGPRTGATRSPRRPRRSRARARSSIAHQRSRLPQSGRRRTADRLQSPLPGVGRSQTHRRRRRRVRVPARVAGQLGATARLHPHQRRAGVARRSRVDAVDDPPPADRRTVPSAPDRTPRRRSARPFILVERIRRLFRQLSYRGHRTDSEQDRQGSHGSAAAQHAGAAEKHHHVAPSDGRRRNRHL